MAVRAAMPNYGTDEEHIVRRLGWAVMVQWPDLPEEVRKLLQAQAVLVHDKHETVQLNEQISVFIDAHEGGK